MAEQEIEQLVNEVLQTQFKAPYSEHIIDDVFHAIQQSPVWLARYSVLSVAQGEHKTRTDVAKAVKAITKMEVIKSSNKSRYPNGLNKTYSTLSKPATADIPAEHST